MMIDMLLRSLPLGCFRPFRRAVVSLPRGNPARSASALLLKHAARSRGRLLFSQVDDIRPLDAPELSFAPVNSTVMEAIYWFGIQGYEGRLADIWRSECRRSRSVLEIGGNVGLFTVIGASATAGSYTVVEPVPVVAKTLRENLRRNGLAGKVELLQAAVIPQATEREITLNIPSEGRDAPVGAHLVEGVEVVDRSSAEVLSVWGYPFVDVAVGRDLIKIDAEGIEAALLASAHDLLVSTRPTLVIEVLPEAQALGQRIAMLARAANYVIYVVPAYGSDNLVRVEPDAFSSEVPQRHRSKDVVPAARPLG